jgi:hypothetical protein
MFLLTLGFAATMLSYLLKYPYFPGVPSYDYYFHLSNALAIVNGSFNLLSASYPPAAHYLIALGIVALPVPPAEAAMLTMILVASLVPVFLYAITGELLGDSRLGLLSAALYIVGNPLWRISLFDGGLYSNHLADLMSLCFLYLILRFSNTRKLHFVPLLAISGVILVASHYTVPVFIAALGLFTLALILSRSAVKPIIVGFACLILPTAVIFAIRPDLISQLISVPKLTSGIVVGVGTQSSAFPFVEFFTVLSQYTPLLFLGIAGIGYALALRRSESRKNPWILFPALWFVMPILLSPTGVLASRFALYALLPLALIIPIATWGISQEIQGLSKRHFRPISSSYSLVATALLLLLLVLPSSPIVQQVQDVGSSTSGTRQLQQSIMNTVLWAKNNTPNDSVFASIGRWEMMFIPPLANRGYVGDFIVPPSQLASNATESGINYVVVWRGLSQLNGEYNASTSFALVMCDQDLCVYHFIGASP